MNAILKSITDPDSALSGVTETIKSIAPTILSAFVILIVGLIIIKAIELIVKRMLVRLKFDDVLKKIDSDGRLPENLKLSKLISKCFYWVLFVILVVVVMDMLQMQSISEKLLDIIAFIPNIIAAILILVAGTFIATTIRKSIETILSSIGMEELNIFGSIIFYFIVFMVLLVALEQLQVDISFIKSNFSLIIAAALSAFSIATLLATIQIFPNIIAYVRNRNSVPEGSNVEIDNVNGKIKRIDRFNLVIDTGKSEVFLPNKEHLS